LDFAFHSALSLKGIRNKISTAYIIGSRGVSNIFFLNNKIRALVIDFCSLFRTASQCRKIVYGLRLFSRGSAGLGRFGSRGGKAGYQDEIPVPTANEQSYSVKPEMAKNYDELLKLYESILKSG
jgi:hypothetical protein